MSTSIVYDPDAAIYATDLRTFVYDEHRDTLVLQQTQAAPADDANPAYVVSPLFDLILTVNGHTFQDRGIDVMNDIRAFRTPDDPLNVVRVGIVAVMVGAYGFENNYTTFGLIQLPCNLTMVLPAME